MSSSSNASASDSSPVYCLLPLFVAFDWLYAALDATVLASSF